MKRVNLLNISDISLDGFKTTKEELKKRLLVPHSVAIKSENVLIAARNQNGKIFFDVVDVVDVKKHLKESLTVVKEMLKIFDTDTYYMEVDKKNPHIKDNFYKNCEKVFENKKKIIYKRRVKI